MKRKEQTMKATEIKNKPILLKDCDWIIAQAFELKALLAYNSEEMVLLNKTRALSAIDTSASALNELKLFIESVGG